MDRIDWDDLRVLLEVARAGSLSRAARALGVNHSTISRRLNAFETRLDTRLFERTRAGYALTPAGEELLGAATRMEREVMALDRRRAGRDPRLTGTLRVATADLGATLVVPELAGFAHAFPGVELEIVADDAFANLTRREADVAVRATNAPPEYLVGRRVATLAMAPYASTDYLDRRTEVRELAEYDWLGWDEGQRHLRSAAWIREHVDPERVRCRTNSPFVLEEAAMQGLGVAFLYCFRADAEPRLRRVRPPLRELEIGLWLLTHEDLRRSARVRSFLDFVTERFVAMRPLLEGRRPLPP